MIKKITLLILILFSVSYTYCQVAEIQNDSITELKLDKKRVENEIDCGDI